MDLTTNYLGLSLRSPLVPSASPLSEKMDNIRQMEQAGADVSFTNDINPSPDRDGRISAEQRRGLSSLAGLVHLRT